MERVGLPSPPAHEEGELVLFFRRRIQEGKQVADIAFN
jgi:hypothetical protein